MDLRFFTVARGAGITTRQLFHLYLSPKPEISNPMPETFYVSRWSARSEIRNDDEISPRRNAAD